MENLTALIFTKDDIRKAIDLIRDIYNVSDEVVIIDSSDKENRKLLETEIKKKGFSKVRVFYAIALGYPDPLRMYALTKCRNKWVMLIDTDERISTKLKEDVKKIIQTSKCDAFAIRRYENVASGQRTESFTWQIRIFKKDKIEYRGIVHEQAIVNGTLHKLEGEEYYMNHILEIKGTASLEYSKIADFERMSYKVANQKFLEYMSKFLMPKKDIRNTMAGKAISGTISLYDKFGFKKQDQELSYTDYLIFYTARDFGDGIKQNKIHVIPAALKNRIKYINKIMERQHRPDNVMEFQISRIINDIGIIKFLGLDKPKTIEKLNKEYKDKPQGIDLLIKLLKKRYKETHKV